jgi:hypothetical protein
LVSTYNFQSTPTLYVIDPAGKVALSMQYPTNVQTLKSTIDALEGRAPAASAQNANSLDLFAKGTDGALWWKHWTGTTWTASTSLGGVLTSPPAATSPSTGVIDVFARGSDGAQLVQDQWAAPRRHRSRRVQLGISPDRLVRHRH